MDMVISFGQVEINTKEAMSMINDKEKAKWNGQMARYMLVNGWEEFNTDGEKWYFLAVK